MNYIKQLQEKIQNTNGIKEDIKDDIKNFRYYLSLDKFKNDTTIQVWEVRDFLHLINKKINDIE